VGPNPASARPRLCVNNVCSDFVERFGAPNRFGWNGVLPEGEVEVRLEFLEDINDASFPTYEGSGTPSGECCKSLVLKVSADGRSLVEAMP
jgi:hypothetical protein